MLDLKNMVLSDLVDMLNSHTAIYMTMLRSGASREEFERYRDEIREMQGEIALRRPQMQTSGSDKRGGTDSVPFMQSAG
jgi:hypothetical protein